MVAPEKLTDYRAKRDGMQRCDAQGAREQQECTKFIWNRTHDGCTFYKNGDYQVCDYTPEAHRNVTAFNKRS